jgi:hypothetical protein
MGALPPAVARGSCVAFALTYFASVVIFAPTAWTVAREEQAAYQTFVREYRTHGARIARESHGCTCDA